MSIGEFLSSIGLSDSVDNSSSSSAESRPTARGTCTSTCTWGSSEVFILVGLHTCGNLASTLLNVYCHCHRVVGLVSLSCCYMKLSCPEETHSPSHGYLEQGETHSPAHGYLEQGERHSPAHRYLEQGERQSPTHGYVELGETHSPAHGYLEQGERHSPAHGYTESVPVHTLGSRHSHGPDNREQSPSSYSAGSEHTTLRHSVALPESSACTSSSIPPSSALPPTKKTFGYPKSDFVFSLPPAHARLSYEAREVACHSLDAHREKLTRGK